MLLDSWTTNGQGNPKTIIAHSISSCHFRLLELSNIAHVQRFQHISASWKEQPPRRAASPGWWCCWGGIQRSSLEGSLPMCPSLEGSLPIGLPCDFVYFYWFVLRKELQPNRKVDTHCIVKSWHRHHVTLHRSLHFWFERVSDRPAVADSKKAQQLHKKSQRSGSENPVCEKIYLVGLCLYIEIPGKDVLNGFLRSRLETTRIHPDKLLFVKLLLLRLLHSSIQN